MQASYLVTIVLPDGATWEDGLEYVEEAVKAWAGSLDPEEDPMSNLDRESVDVIAR